VLHVEGGVATLTVSTATGQYREGVKFKSVLSRTEFEIFVQAPAPRKSADMLATSKLQMQILELARDAKEGSSMETLSATVERSLRLVGQVLTSPRVSHQPIVRVPIDLMRYVISTTRQLAPGATLENILLPCEGGSLIAPADVAPLRLLIGSTIESGMAYTPDNGEVDVALSNDAESIICAVSDSGPGIPEKERDHALQHFYRVGTLQAQGPRLGLAIAVGTAARPVVKVSLETPESGQGLPVGLVLPRARALAGT
jgi:signal transduction histidine kinase